MQAGGARRSLCPPHLLILEYPLLQQLLVELLLLSFLPLLLCNHLPAMPEDLTSLGDELLLFLALLTLRGKARVRAHPQILAGPIYLTSDLSLCRLLGDGPCYPLILVTRLLSHLLLQLLTHPRLLPLELLEDLRLLRLTQSRHFLEGGRHSFEAG